MNVRPYDQNQSFLFPPSLKDFLPADHEAHIINDVVEKLDLSSFYAAIPKVGNSSYHPKLTLKILFYGLVEGITSSRVLAKKCGENVAYIFLAALQRPNFRTINTFRTKHMEDISRLFAQIVKICQDLGLVSMEHIAVDGTRIKANASAENLYDKERAAKHIDKIEEEIRKRLEEMNAQDELEDERYGNDVSGYEVPDDLKDLETRRKKLDQLVERLNQEKDGKKKNLTDPESEIQKTEFGKKSGYNGQVGVDSKHNVIVAADVTDSPSDVHQLIPMLEQTQANTGKLPEKLSADAGYSSYANLENIPPETDAYIPDRQYQHQIKQGNKTGQTPYDKAEFKYLPDEDVYVCPGGAKAYPPVFAPIIRGKESITYTIKGAWRCNSCKHSLKGCTNRFGTNRTITITGKERLIDDMRRKLQSKKGKEIYKYRKNIVETVFGHLKKNQRLREFTMRGLKKVQLEFKMWCIGYNLKKIIIQGTS